MDVIDLAAARERHRVTREARAWVQSLHATSVTVDEFKRYFQWLLVPGNPDAYEKADREARYASRHPL